MDGYFLAGELNELLQESESSTSKGTIIRRYLSTCLTFLSWLLLATFLFLSHSHSHSRIPMRSYKYSQSSAKTSEFDLIQIKALCDS